MELNLHVCKLIYILLIGLSISYGIYVPTTNSNQLIKNDTIKMQQSSINKQFQEKSYDINQQFHIPKNNYTQGNYNIYNKTEQAQKNYKKRERRELSDWLIAPNTRWCGRGNSANGTYNHLGGSSAADKCCRKHDHCQLNIPALSTRYELFNYLPYTLSHCRCDRNFRTCLKMANDPDANTIGKIFFNMIQTNCFVLRTQMICQDRDEDGNCLQHYVRQKALLKENKKF